MSSIFNPTGTLNIAWDASDLPGKASGNNEISGDFTRCKNLRINLNGKVVTRDGSAKINSSAITAPTWIEEFDGKRFSFSGSTIYQDESSIATGLTDAQWTAFQYNAYNDTTKQIFATNGTDRKRITDGAVNEWGIAAPTVAPTIGVGAGNGLSGFYNVKYTYVRKDGTTIINESDPSPAASFAVEFDDNSIQVDVTQPTDSQVTHIRLYRTVADGGEYFLDLETPVNISYEYGYVHDWEDTGGYISGNGYDFTITDSTNGTENTYSFEENFKDAVTASEGISYGGEFSTYDLLLNALKSIIENN